MHTYKHTLQDQEQGEKLAKLTDTNAQLALENAK